MIWLTKYIRWIIVSSSILISIVIYYYVDQTYLATSLRTIRLTQFYALTALVYLYTALLHSPIYAVFPLLPGRPLWRKARRGLGVSAWYFALLHASNAFFFQLGGFPGLAFLGNSYITPIILSTTALIILTAMAGTSFDFVIRLMGKNWKRLHRFVYLAALLILIHALFLGTHFQDLTTIIPLILSIAVILLLILEGIRFDRYVQNQYQVIPKYTLIFPLWCIALVSLIGYLYLPNPQSATSNSLNIHSQHQQMAEQAFNKAVASPATIYPQAKEKRYTVSFSAPDNTEPNRIVTLNFKVFDASTGLPITLFAKNFEKIAHLVMVDNSLNQFEHLHPELQNDQLTVPYTFKKPGVYHLYLDFMPFGQTEQQFAFTLRVGKSGTLEYPSQEQLPESTEIGTIKIAFSTEGSLRSKDVSLGKTKFNFLIKDSKTGREIKDIQPYLGAFGHLVMIQRDTFEYIHVHPTTTTTPRPDEHSGPQIEFQPIGLFGPIPPGPYILYAQFKHNDKIIVGKFSVIITP